jgi:hypothetical protein
VPALSGVPGASLTGIEDQCTIVSGEPDITGSMVVTERATADVWDMLMTQNLLFTIELQIAFGPITANAIIQTDSQTVIDGVADGTVPGSLDFREFDKDIIIPPATDPTTFTYNVNAAADGTVFCCADTNTPPDCSPPTYGNAAIVLCGAVPPLAPGNNSLPLTGDPGARTFPLMTLNGSWQFGDGAPNINGWYLVNPRPLAGNGTQFAALAGVQTN